MFLQKTEAWILEWISPCLGAGLLVFYSLKSIFTKIQTKECKSVIQDITLNKQDYKFLQSSGPSVYHPLFRYFAFFLQNILMTNMGKDG